MLPVTPAIELRGVNTIVFGMWMLVERLVDAFRYPILLYSFRTRIPHPILQGIIHDAIRGNALHSRDALLEDALLKALRLSAY